MTTMLARPQPGDIIVGICEPQGAERTGRVTEVLGPIPDSGQHRFRIDAVEPDRTPSPASVIVTFRRYGHQCWYCWGAIELTDPSGRGLTDWRHLASQKSACPAGTPLLQPERSTFDELITCPDCGYEHRFAAGA